MNRDRKQQSLNPSRCLKEKILLTWTYLSSMQENTLFKWFIIKKQKHKYSLFNERPYSYFHVVLLMKECPPINTSALEKSNEVVIYPSPASKLFNIQPNGIESIVIYNYLGEFLLTELDVSKSIDCSLWPSGIYLIEGRYANHDIVRQRLMVNYS